MERDPLRDPSRPCHTPSSPRNVAIPMPYIPSQPQQQPGPASEINIDMLTERRSSFELRPCVSSASSVQSTAVVKFSSLSDPTPLARLAEQTNLNLPPSNWLKDDPSSKGFVPSPNLHSGFTSFRMANDFVDCLADVDVVSDGENIKKLLKIPYSKSPISMVVHRVGKTLLLDDFDINRYLLRRSASEWEWIRKFFFEIVLQQIDKVCLFWFYARFRTKHSHPERECCRPEERLHLSHTGEKSRVQVPVQNPAGQPGQ